MPTPIALCLEDVGAPMRDRYLRCDAVTGARPGLDFDAAGQLTWQCDQPAARLFVSADERLILMRLESALPLVVRRAGRHCNVPTGKPVVLYATRPEERAP